MRHAIALVVATLATTTAHAEVCPPGVVPRPNSFEFYGADPYANALREHMTAAAKSLVERRRPFVVSSGDRPHPQTAGANAIEGRPPSYAHAYGAIDFSSSSLSRDERHEEARLLSALLGPQFQVIVEENESPAPGELGPHAWRRLYFYRNGAHAFDRIGAPADATHTHVSPILPANQSAFDPRELVEDLGLTPTEGDPQTQEDLLRPCLPALAPIRFPTVDLFGPGWLGFSRESLRDALHRAWAQFFAKYRAEVERFEKAQRAQKPLDPFADGGISIEFGGSDASPPSNATPPTTTEPPIETPDPHPVTPVPPPPPPLPPAPPPPVPPVLMICPDFPNEDTCYAFDPKVNLP